ncbi:MAG TPA: hypothetical protein VLS90_19410, partial [Thermodesulfobacteriota bacterium]|nr:hypothetical protein [Thermodesulfobacteriota bacterium]
MNLKAKTILTRAKIQIILTEPFWASLLLKLEFDEDVSAPTMWTDGTRVGYNPDFVIGLAPEELMGVLAHEVGHCILLHTTRRAGRNGRRWNIACDYSLNHVIEEGGFRLPESRLRKPEYDRLSCDQVYELLSEELPLGSQESDPGGCGEVREVESGSERERLSAEWKLAAATAAASA